jgi:membrane fusion protein (multidrug efflux system)
VTSKTLTHVPVQAVPVRSLALIGLLAISAAGCSGAAHEAPATPAQETTRAVPVRGANVEQRDLRETLTVTGTLRPKAEIKVIAEVAARLDRLAKDEGAVVSKGELLAVLDDTDYNLTLQRAKAALAVADANRAHAAAERDRANSLLKTGGITDKDHLSAQVNLQVSEASLAQAKVEVAIAEQNVTRTRIVAPFSGRLIDRLSDAGSYLASGTPIFTLVDDSVLEFRGAVPSSDYGKVKLNAPVTLTMDALPDVEVTGQVTRVVPMVQERNRSFELIARVPGRQGLVAGLFARAAIYVREVKGALLVPPSAVVRDGANPDRADVFVVANNKAERREISLGVEQPDAIQVIKGLSGGETVVIDPPVSLTSGATVQVQGKSAAAATPAAPAAAQAPAASH